MQAHSSDRFDAAGALEREEHRRLPERQRWGIRPAQANGLSVFGATPESSEGAIEPVFQGYAVWTPHLGLRSQSLTFTQADIGPLLCHFGGRMATTLLGTRLHPRTSGSDESGPPARDAMGTPYTRQGKRTTRVFQTIKC